MGKGLERRVDRRLVVGPRLTFADGRERLRNTEKCDEGDEELERAQHRSLVERSFELLFPSFEITREGALIKGALTHLSVDQITPER